MFLNLLERIFHRPAYSEQNIDKSGFGESDTNNEPAIMPKTLEDLASGKKRYFKFSQSDPHLKTSAENHFIEYQEGKLVQAKDPDKGLSFVAEENIALCYMYGDQITEFNFDSNNGLFCSIAKTPIKKIGGYLREYESSVLLVKKNYSLKSPETLLLMFQMSSEEACKFYLVAASSNSNPWNPLRKLLKLGYTDSANFLKLILEKNENINSSVKQEIPNIYNEYLKRYPQRQV